VTGPPRSEPPPYAGVADLLEVDDLPWPEPAEPPVTARIDGPAGSPESLGHRVTRRFFSLCEHPRTRERTMRLLRASADSAVAGRLVVAFWSRVAFRPLLRSRRLDHATARIELACAQLGGVAVLRYVTRMEPVTSMSVDELVRMLGPAVDATLTAPYRSPV
jgi:hypothetical protein